MSSSWLLLFLFPLYLPFPRSFFFPLLLIFHFCHLSVCLWSKKLMEWQHRDWVALLVMQRFTLWRGLEAGYQMGKGQGRPEPHLVCHTWTLCSKWCPYGDLTWEMLTGHCPILGKRFTCVWSKWAFSQLLTLVLSPWTGGKWTLEAAVLGNHSHGLVLSKQFVEQLRLLSSWRTFWSCPGMIFALTPGSGTCPVTSPPCKSQSSQLFLRQELSPSTSSISDSSSFFVLFLWQHLLGLWHVLLKFWFSFLPRETTPFSQLAWQTTTGG